MVVFAVKSFILAPEGSSWSARIAIFLFSSVPLLIFVPGLLRDSDRTYTWICFVILGYFTYSVTALAIPSQAAPIDWIFCGLTVTLFTFAMMFVRYKKRVLAGL